VEWLLVALALGAWGWYSGTLAKEAAVQAARRLCAEHDQQLLDETVALKGMKPKRDGSGRMRLWRLYGFDFSGDGEGRHRGEIALLGCRQVSSNLELDGFTLYEEAPDEHGPRRH